MVLLDVLGVRGYIYEEEVGRRSYEGPTRVGARLPASWPPRCFLDVHSKSPGLRLFQKKDPREGSNPFDIPFLRNTEIGEKTTICTGPFFRRLVPKII